MMASVAVLAWIALILELTGNWVVGDKQRWGFIVKILGSIAWLSVAVILGIHGLTASAILGGLISVRNFHQWKGKIK